MGEREAGRDGARHVRRRPADVRRVHDPGAGPSSVPRRAGARRRRSGHRLDGDAGRASRLVPVSRAGRLQGLRRRSSRAWTIAAASRSARRLCRSGGGAREHRRPVHAAERESRADAERVSEASHAVARCGERRLARSRSTRRRAGRQLRRRPPLRPAAVRAAADDKAVRLPRARDRDAAARRSPRTSCSRCRRPTCSTRRGVRRVPTCSTRSVPRSS